MTAGIRWVKVDRERRFYASFGNRDATLVYEPAPWGDNHTGGLRWHWIIRSRVVRPPVVEVDGLCATRGAAEAWVVLFVDVDAPRRRISP